MGECRSLAEHRAQAADFAGPAARQDEQHGWPHEPAACFINRRPKTVHRFSKRVPDIGAWRSAQALVHLRFERHDCQNMIDIPAHAGRTTRMPCPHRRRNVFDCCDRRAQPLGRDVQWEA